MENGRRNFYIYSSIITFLLLAIIVFVISRTYVISASPSELFACNTIKFSGAGAINLVFFASESEAKKYSDYLLKSEPYKEYQDKFNVYSISDYQPDCEIYRGAAFLCYSKQTIKAAASCPNDYVFVLKNGPSEIRSSSYVNVLSLNTAHPLSVILHEFGHAFSNFGEEYYTGKDPPRGSQNCQKSCSVFGNNKDGCFKECSQGDLMRSIESGVMRTLSTDDYGEFDESIIVSEIEKQSSEKMSAITGNVVSELDCASQISSVIIYDSQTGEPLGISKIVGCPSSISSLKKDKLDTRFIFTDSPGKDEIEEGNAESSFPAISGETYLSDVPAVITVPQESELVLATVDSDGNVRKKNIDLSGVKSIEKSAKYEFDKNQKDVSKESPAVVEKVFGKISEATFGNEKTTKLASAKNYDGNYVSYWTSPKNSAGSSLAEDYYQEPASTKDPNQAGRKISPTAQVIFELQSQKSIFGILAILIVVILIYFFVRRNKDISFK